MGIEHVHSPAYFRKRAEGFRRRAEDSEHREARDSLVKLAETYDALAQRAQKIRTVQELQK